MVVVSILGDADAVGANGMAGSVPEIDFSLLSDSHFPQRRPSLPVTPYGTK